LPNRTRSLPAAPAWTGRKGQESARS
jgi:hypothetical protein